jgi:hypothetical protein
MESKFYKLATENNLKRQLLVNPFEDIKRQVSNQSFRTFGPEKLWWEIVRHFHIEHFDNPAVLQAARITYNQLAEKYQI